jgi:hypothetical protein
MKIEHGTDATGLHFIDAGKSGGEVKVDNSTGSAQHTKREFERHH